MGLKSHHVVRGVCFGVGAALGLVFAHRATSGVIHAWGYVQPYVPALSLGARVLFALLIGHALADYPLQGDFLSKGKNRFSPLPGVPWYWCMGAHCLIHAGFVWLITGSPLLGLLELIVHFYLDDSKCSGNSSFDADQIFHIVCKLEYVGLLMLGLDGGIHGCLIS